jgi:hypothetical protein
VPKKSLFGPSLRTQNGNEKGIKRLLGKKTRARKERHKSRAILSYREGPIWVSRFSEAINRRPYTDRPGIGARR